METKIQSSFTKEDFTELSKGNLSIDFVEKNKDKLDWNEISKNPNLINYDFVKKYQNKIIFSSLACLPIIDDKIMAEFLYYKNFFYKLEEGNSIAKNLMENYDFPKGTCHKRFNYYTDIGNFQKCIVRRNLSNIYSDHYISSKKRDFDYFQPKNCKGVYTAPKRNNPLYYSRTLHTPKIMTDMFVFGKLNYLEICLFMNLIDWQYVMSLKIYIEPDILNYIFSHAVSVYIADPFRFGLDFGGCCSEMTQVIVITKPNREYFTMERKGNFSIPATFPSEPCNCFYVFENILKYQNVNSLDFNNLFLNCYETPKGNYANRTIPPYIVRLLDKLSENTEYVFSFDKIEKQLINYFGVKIMTTGEIIKILENRHIDMMKHIDEILEKQMEIRFKYDEPVNDNKNLVLAFLNKINDREIFVKIIQKYLYLFTKTEIETLMNKFA